MAQQLMLLDTASLYFRAFHGVPDSLRRGDGTPVNAVRGLLDMIARLASEFSPSHLVACWDNNWRPGWRVALLPSYKAHRVAAGAASGGSDVETVPEGLTAQIPLIREVLAAAGIAVVGAEDHEADDVIGTYSESAGMPVDVVTGDRDLFQLINDDQQVRVLYTARGMKNLEELTEASVVARYRVLPSQYADYATLRGDTSDGLPGVAGIGEKTAAQLLAEYGSLDGLLAAAAGPGGTVSAPVRAKLGAAGEYLQVAPAVVKVVRDLPLPSLEQAGARLHAPDGQSRRTLENFGNDWNLGGAMTRFLAALDGYPPAQ